MQKGFIFQLQMLASFTQTHRRRTNYKKRESSVWNYFFWILWAPSNERETCGGTSCNMFRLRTSGHAVRGQRGTVEQFFGCRACRVGAQNQSLVSFMAEGKFGHAKIRRHMASVARATAVRKVREHSKNSRKIFENDFNLWKTIFSVSINSRRTSKCSLTIFG